MKIGLIVDKAEVDNRIRTQQRVMVIGYLLCVKYKVVEPQDIKILYEPNTDYSCINITNSSPARLYSILSRVINDKSFTKEYTGLLRVNFGRILTVPLKYDYCLVTSILGYGLERSYTQLLLDAIGAHRGRTCNELDMPVKDIIGLIIERKVNKSKEKLQLDENIVSTYKDVSRWYNIDHTEEELIQDYYVIIITHNLRKYAEDASGFDIKVDRDTIVKLSNKMTLTSIVNKSNLITMYIKYMLSPYFIYSEYYHIYDGKDYLIYNTLCTEYARYLYSEEREFSLWEYWRDKLSVSHTTYETVFEPYDKTNNMYKYFKTKFKRKYYKRRSYSKK